MLNRQKIVLSVLNEVGGPIVRLGIASVMADMSDLEQVHL